MNLFYHTIVIWKCKFSGVTNRHKIFIFFKGILLYIYLPAYYNKTVWGGAKEYTL